jgi:hypothetical protein
MNLITEEGLKLQTEGEKGLEGRVEKGATKYDVKWGG